MVRTWVWLLLVGAGKSVEWPTGLGAKGNEDVAGQIKSTPGSIGYVELAYAVQSDLPYASLRNRAGEFVAPSLESTTAAAAAGTAASMPDDLRMSIVDPEGAGAYPIAAFTYILAYEDTADAARGRALADFLWWAVREGQQFGPDLHWRPAISTSPCSRRSVSSSSSSRSSRT